MQEIEAWILALLGERRSERHSDAKAVLKEKHEIVGCAQKVATVEAADLARVPEDATSLRLWLGRAERSLAARR